MNKILTEKAGQSKASTRIDSDQETVEYVMEEHDVRERKLQALKGKGRKELRKMGSKANANNIGFYPKFFSLKPSQASPIYSTLDRSVFSQKPSSSSSWPGE